MKRIRVIALFLVLITLFLAACATPAAVMPSVNAPQAHPSPVTTDKTTSKHDDAEALGNRDTRLTVYFLDVGQADAALVVCDGETMLIDGGNAADSDFIYAFLRNHGISHLNYIVATHAHEDHVGGLSGALNYATVDVALCPVTSYESRAFESFLKYLDKQGITITVPKPNDRFKLGSADVVVLGPIYESNAPNNTSIVLKITHKAINFLFTGDAEREEEHDILDAGYDISSTVLKVGHHGSDTSTTYPFLREIMPDYAVISCGKNNSYGHPHEATLSKLRDADVKVFRTDMQGTITCVSDGTAITFTTERNADIQTNPTVVEEVDAPMLSNPDAAATPTLPPPPLAEGIYIGNINSRMFHVISCNSLPVEKNRVYFDTRKEAAAAGYVPCKLCNP